MYSKYILCDLQYTPTYPHTHEAMVKPMERVWVWVSNFVGGQIGYPYPYPRGTHTHVHTRVSHTLDEP